MREKHLLHFQSLSKHTNFVRYMRIFNLPKNMLYIFYSDSFVCVRQIHRTTMNRITDIKSRKWCITFIRGCNTATIIRFIYF
jgi:hypothetical protein